MPTPDQKGDVQFKTIRVKWSVFSFLSMPELRQIPEQEMSNQSNSQMSRNVKPVQQQPDVKKCQTFQSMGGLVTSSWQWDTGTSYEFL